MGFSRQEYWSGLLCPPPGDLPDLGTKHSSLKSPDWQAGSLSLVPPGKLKSALWIRIFPSSWTSLPLLHDLESVFTINYNCDFEESPHLLGSRFPCQQDGNKSCMRRIYTKHQYKTWIVHAWLTADHTPSPFHTVSAHSQVQMPSMPIARLQTLALIIGKCFLFGYAESFWMVGISILQEQHSSPFSYTIISLHPHAEYLPRYPWSPSHSIQKFTLEPALLENC